MRGRDYGSVFVHYKPVGWSWQPEDIIAAVTPDWHEPSVSRERQAELDAVGRADFEVYRRKYFKERGLGLLDFVGGDLLALPVQNAAMMAETVPHSEL